jgi:hypothetical protein
MNYVDELRETMNFLQEHMDIIEKYGMSRTFLKKQLSKIRKQLTVPHSQKPTPAEFYNNEFNTKKIRQIIEYMEWKPLYAKEYARQLKDALTYIDRYVKVIPNHPDYGKYPLGHPNWVDEQGNNIKHTKRYDAKVYLQNLKNKEEGVRGY